MVVHAYNSSTQEVEAGKFMTSLGYMARPWFKKQTEPNQNNRKKQRNQNQHNKTNKQKDPVVLA
jgi:hypothetical protein